MPKRMPSVALILVASLSLGACTPLAEQRGGDPASTGPTPSATVEPPESSATTYPRTLDEFRAAVPEAADIPFERFGSVNVQQNGRQWVVGSGDSPGGAAAVRDLVVERVGEFPEADLATTDDGTVYGVTAELSGRLMELTLNDLGSDSYLFYVLLAG